MELHIFHFSPRGIVRAYNQLIAGRHLCRSKKKHLITYIPQSINSMTAAWNFSQTLRKLSLPAPRTIIDVGANISQMTKLLLLSCQPETKVISFEPNPALTPIGEKIELALSDKDGQTELYIPENDDLWATIKSDHEQIADETKHFPVEEARFDSLVAQKRVDWEQLKQPILVKIDTEGSEKLVIDGFGNFLHDITYLLIEIHNTESFGRIFSFGRNYSFVHLCKKLADHGFTESKILYSCYDGPDAPPYNDILFWKEYDPVSDPDKS